MEFEKMGILFKSSLNTLFMDLNKARSGSMRYYTVYLAIQSTLNNIAFKKHFHKLS